MDEISKSLKILKDGRYTIDRGCIIPPCIFNVETKEETYAIDYLCAEWDFAFENKRINKK